MSDLPQMQTIGDQSEYSDSEGEYELCQEPPAELKQMKETEDEDGINMNIEFSKEIREEIFKLIGKILNNVLPAYILIDEKLLSENMQNSNFMNKFIEKYLPLYVKFLPLPVQFVIITLMNILKATTMKEKGENDEPEEEQPEIILEPVD